MISAYLIKQAFDNNGFLFADPFPDPNKKLVWKEEVAPYPGLPDPNKYIRNVRVKVPFIPAVLRSFVDVPSYLQNSMDLTPEQTQQYMKQVEDGRIQLAKLVRLMSHANGIDKTFLIRHDYKIPRVIPIYYGEQGIKDFVTDLRHFSGLPIPSDKEMESIVLEAKKRGPAYSTGYNSILNPWMEYKNGKYVGSYDFNGPDTYYARNAAFNTGILSQTGRIINSSMEGSTAHETNHGLNSKLPSMHIGIVGEFPSSEYPANRASYTELQHEAQLVDSGMKHLAVYLFNKKYGRIPTSRADWGRALKDAAFYPKEYEYGRFDTYMENPLKSYVNNPNKVYTESTVDDWPEYNFESYGYTPRMTWKNKNWYGLAVVPRSNKGSYIGNRNRWVNSMLHNRNIGKSKLRYLENKDLLKDLPDLDESLRKTLYNNQLEILDQYGDVAPVDVVL